MAAIVAFLQANAPEAFLRRSFHQKRSKSSQATRSASSPLSSPIVPALTPTTAPETDGDGVAAIPARVIREYHSCNAAAACSRVHKCSSSRSSRA
jgi:hypothetical protein